MSQPSHPNRSSTTWAESFRTWVWPVVGLLVLALLLLPGRPFLAHASEKANPATSVKALNKNFPNALPPVKNPPSGQPLPDTDENIEQADMYGVVLSVENEGAPPGGKLLKPVQDHEILQHVKVRLASAAPVPRFKGQVVTIDNVIGENPAYNIPLRPGVRVLLNMEKNPTTGQWTFYIANRDRTPAIIILGTVFIMALLVIGGVEMAKHALLVALILVGCYKAVFPAVLAGTTGAEWILLICFMYTILASFIYQTPGQRSFSREQSVVILGTLGGLLILALLMWVMHLITPLDGYSNEGLASLWYRSPKMDYWTFFMAGVLLGYQGLLFHLCWSLAQHRRQEDALLSFGQRFHIVMLRGRRLLGPMLSSVGLLFLGLFMPILLQLQGTPTAQFVNLESTASMLTYAFAGGLTLILTVPLTALISAFLLSGERSEPVTPPPVSLEVHQ